MTENLHCDIVVLLHGRGLKYIRIGEDKIDKHILNFEYEEDVTSELEETVSYYEAFDNDEVLDDLKTYEDEAFPDFEDAAEEILKEDISEQKTSMRRGRPLPRFWKYTHKIPRTKNGKFRDPDDIKEARRKFEERIDYRIKCPMNYLQEALDDIERMKPKRRIPVDEFLNPIKGRVDSRQENKVLEFAKRLDTAIKRYQCSKKRDYSYANDPDMNLIAYNTLKEETDEILKDMRKSIRNMNCATMQQIIRLSMGGGEHMGIPEDFRKAFQRYDKKILQLLYDYDKEKFLSCFSKGDIDIKVPDPVPKSSTSGKKVRRSMKKNTKNH